jgi:hypothetical protein
MSGHADSVAKVGEIKDFIALSFATSLPGPHGILQLIPFIKCKHSTRIKGTRHQWIVKWLVGIKILYPFRVAHVTVSSVELVGIAGVAGFHKP